MELNKPLTFFALCFLLTVSVNAQDIKAPGKDSLRAGKANDRLKNSGPVNGWPTKSGKMDSLKYKNDSIAAIRRADSIKRVRKNN